MLVGWVPTESEYRGAIESIFSRCFADGRFHCTRQLRQKGGEYHDLWASSASCKLRFSYETGAFEVRIANLQTEDDRTDPATVPNPYPPTERDGWQQWEPKLAFERERRGVAETNLPPFAGDDELVLQMRTSAARLEPELAFLMQLFSDHPPAGWWDAYEPWHAAKVRRWLAHRTNP